MSDNNSDDDDGELYDEFGNYIGPELDDSSDDSDDSDDDDDNDSDEEQDRPDGASRRGRGDDDERSVVSGIDDNNNNNAMVLADDDRATGMAADPVNAIVLHEDKEHYPSAEDTFGEGVRTAVLDEDAMDLDQPIVEPVKIKSHHVHGGQDGGGQDDEDGSGGANKKSNNNNNNNNTVEFIYNDEFLTSHLLSNETTSTRRGIAIVGHLHHGKTTLIDTLMEPTLVKNDQWDPLLSSSEDLLTDNNMHDTIIKNNKSNNNNNGTTKTLHYTDIWKSERERQMSLVSCPITLSLSDTRGKNYGITILDCPGHVQFHDESVSALRSMDGAILCVDCIEGIMLHTEMLLKQIITVDGLPICLVITKLDRLIVELKLPPKDAYYKLLNIIESVNKMVRELSRGKYPEITPTNGNVAFSSSIHGYLFTLESITETYLEQQQNNESSLGTNMTSKQFSKKLWGNYWYCSTKKKFYNDSSKCISRQDQTNRSFITFVLEPIYKIYSTCLGESEIDISSILKPLGVHLTKVQLRSSGRPLLRMAMTKFFETASCGFVNMIVKHM